MASNSTGSALLSERAVDGELGADEHGSEQLARRATATESTRFNMAACTQVPVMWSLLSESALKGNVGQHEQESVTTQEQGR
jgi:hypothetical protein